MNWKPIGAVAAIAAVALAVDWNQASRGDLRRFDPAEVGRLETAMWRSYYDRRPAALFLELTEMLRKQYGLSATQSYAAAFRASRAAFVFKDGRSRAEYEKALPDLERYFRAILPSGAAEAARLELEWWIVHRERDRYGQAALESALGSLQATIYRLPAERFATHARMRAEAMLLRDKMAEGGEAPEAVWPRIRTLLDGSWTALHEAVNR